jgi:hypothetical protein
VSIPLGFRRLVDDAAIFPPGLLPLDQALIAHRAHLESAYAPFVGPFIIDSARLAELPPRREPAADSGFAISVVVASPAELGSVIARAAADGRDLAGLEVKLDYSAPLPPQVRDIAACVPESVPTYVEVPRPAHPEWPDVLDAVDGAGLRMKFRTGGTTSAAFPDEHELAAWIAAAVGAGVSFKCTAGLHHAVRHTDIRTGLEHHGYLNVLAATVAATTGAAAAAVERKLAQRDAASLARTLRETPADLLATARAYFTSYGSCSISEPLEDLRALGLIPDTDA